MGHVFISYRRDDIERVRRLVSALQADGLDVWWDQLIEPAAPWEQSIESALADADAVVVCWSGSAVLSENVRAEARMAMQDDRLVQTYLTDCTPPLFFGERQGISLVDWYGDRATDQYQLLVGAVRAIISGSPAPVAVRPTRSEPSDIGDDDPRIKALSPTERLSLYVSPLDLGRSTQHKNHMEMAREYVRRSVLNGGLFNWAIARIWLVHLKSKCREDEAWHRRKVRKLYENALVRELQMAHVIDTFRRRMTAIRDLEADL